MDRRTFVLLSSTAFLAPGRASAIRATIRRQGAAAGRLRFTLDPQRRWSVWFIGAESPVPLLQDVELGAWVGDKLITLANLEDITEGTRRPPGGEALVLRGRAAGVFLEAEFAWEIGPTPSPRGAVSLRIYPDQGLPSIRGVRYGNVDATAVLAGGDQPLVALLNGGHSGDASRVERLTAGVSAESRAACGLGRGNRALALAFDAAEPGEGRITYGDGRLEFMSEWHPARPVFPQGDAGTLRIAYEPDGDPLAALRLLWTPTSPVDQERLNDAVAPAGWRSPTPGGEELIVANLEAATQRFSRHDFRMIHLSDGYQRAAGDWDTNARFPQGHRWLTDRIHARGVLAAIWVAPFAAAERSGVPAAHPEWLVRQAGEPLVLDQRESWGGRVFGLDGAHAGVQEWLFALGRRLVRDWGYDAVRCDLLGWGTAGEHAGGLTRAEAFRRGLAAFRDGLGADTVLLGAGAPLQHSAGLVNGMRIGPTTGTSWGSVQAAARATALRSFYHRAVWLNDPGPLAVAALRESSARVATTLAAMGGGVTLLGDDLTTLSDAQVAVLRRSLPPAPGGARPLEAVRPEEHVAPAITSGTTITPITGTWRFRTGDDLAYADPGFDDSVWETITVPGAWEDAGRAEYDGFAWYRVRFTLPALATTNSRTRGDEDVWLDLGRLDDADETFVNGTRVGQTGAFPPDHRGDALAYRRYRVPASVLNRGGENVLAVRAYDAAGRGGLWSTRRDRPPETWVHEGRDGWWTVALVNWDDDPRKLRLALGAARIAGDRFTAYDVWGARPLRDVTEAMEAEVGGRDVLVVALRAAASHPRVIGSTRHVVQGAVDIASESWDAATRTLRVRAQALDARPYAVTVAVPRGLVPGTCTAAPACTMRRLESGHVVLEWPGSATTREIEWALPFRAPPARRSRE